MSKCKLLSVDIVNYQSHKNSHFDFCDGVNTIGGESSNGKTAIMRGTDWLCSNKPGGIDFVSDWIKVLNKSGNATLAADSECAVHFKLIDEEENIHTISRRKSTKGAKGVLKNIYEVDGVVLEAMGASVPESVSNLLNLSDCNVQQQDDPYFLLTQSPGKVAARLNELVGLSSIDDAFKMVSAEKRSSNTKVSLLEQEASNLQCELNSLAHVPILENLWSTVKTDYEKAEKLDIVINDMQKTIEEWEHTNTILKSMPNFDRLSIILKSNEKRVADIKVLDTSICEMNALYTEYTKLEKDLVVLPMFCRSRIYELQGEVDSIESKGNIIESMTALQTDYEKTTKMLNLINLPSKTSYDEFIKDADRYKEINTEVSNIDYLTELYNDTIQDMKECSVSDDTARLINESTKNIEEIEKYNTTISLMDTDIEIYDDLKDDEEILESQIKIMKKKLPKACPLCGHKMEK